MKVTLPIPHLESAQQMDCVESKVEKGQQQETAKPDRTGLVSDHDAKRHRNQHSPHCGVSDREKKPSESENDLTKTLRLERIQ